ncbi:thiamine pyrophosphate-dependent dehydrogenase E1 component subunit alpha [Actinokineospora diospyrosa]|uniref:Pyruvate dehydrogenase E1 component alpha subunit n=1 Tax=Actinokineospora diospyrosa TaxID=103728 RepID=A0ABT1IGG4_9PSEU|nr:thiamine pyrophosphate-dependent dehydrogenase E1 component subunit alpha [Actinokineospora diospyrosa]MCP2271366.1 pyruvate dehydrogenase E1 component alpha subunit [Actinokineospora diospyrosa]
MADNVANPAVADGLAVAGVTAVPATAAVPAGPTVPSSLELYRTMRFIRRFEERAIDLVRAGEIFSGIHPCIGQEAVAAGACAALAPDDIVLSSHRGHGHLLAKGSDPGRVMAEMAGRVTGIDKGRGGSFHPSDFTAGVYNATGTVGHGAGIAAGIAWAAAKAGEPKVVLSFFGDGAVTQGALLEGFNLAGLWQLPVVYICENNRYATTLPVETAVAGTITGRGEAFGIPSSVVDGQDAEVVHEAVAEAVARARSGGGPSLLEMRTYRYHGHHTFEMLVRLRYRDQAEVNAWKERDPLDIQAARIDAAAKDRVDAEVELELDEVVRFAVDSPRPDPADAMDHYYADGFRPRPGVSL